MSFITALAIQNIAESLAISKLTQDASKALAPHVDVRLKEIIQEGCKFSRHSKRSLLNSEDINNALQFYNCEVLHGFSGKDPLKFVRAGGQADLLYLQDLEISTKQIIEQPLPRVPVEVGLVPHWLTVDGVQPRTAEHAPIERQRAKRRRIEAARPVATAPGGPALLQQAKAQDGLGQEAAVVIPPVRQVLSAELQVYMRRVEALVQSAQEFAETEPAGAFCGWTLSNGGLKARLPDSPVAERIRNERALLASLAVDPGIQPLAPALVDLVVQQVKHCMKQLPQLYLLVKIGSSMLQNPHIQLELYLHKLISPLMTCLVTKRIGHSPLEDHWSVRTAAAHAIALICQAYGDKYVDLQLRICKQLAKALTDVTKPVTTMFGAVVGLTSLGHRAVQTMILPVLPSVMNHAAAVQLSSTDSLVCMEVQRLEGALLQACALSTNRALDSRLCANVLAVTKTNAQALGLSAKIDLRGQGIDQRCNEGGKENAGEMGVIQYGRAAPSSSIPATGAKGPAFVDAAPVQLVQAACIQFGERLQPLLHDTPIEHILV